jgi:anti-anti-sigma factor
MQIQVEPQDDHAILHLRGEFDTYYVPRLQKEIEDLQKSGVHHVVLNLRLVKFINSTALGAIIKASKSLGANGGRLVLSRPSPFCRDIVQKVGLDRVVPIYDSDEEAAAGLFAGKAAPARTAEGAPKEDESSVLFTPVDMERIEHFLSETRRFKDKVVNPIHGHAFGTNWTAVGRMLALDENGLRFSWTGGDTGLDPFAMGQLLAIGTDLKLKFRLPLFQPGYCEAIGTISEVEERSDGVRIGATFSKIDDKTRGAVRQYAADLRFLKDEFRRATGQ